MFIYYHVIQGNHHIERLLFTFTMAERSTKRYVLAFKSKFLPVLFLKHWEFRIKYEPLQIVVTGNNKISSVMMKRSTTPAIYVAQFL